MTTLHWYLENYTEKEAMAKLEASIIKQGFPCTNASNFQENNTPEPYKHLDCVISHCSIQSALHITNQKSWIPGVFCNFNEYKCTQYYPVLSKYIFNDHYLILPYGDVLRRKHFIFDTVGYKDTVFIRPDSGFKPFPGKLLFKEHFETDINNLGFGTLPPSELIIFATPHNINREWRLFVTNERVITASQYQHNGKSLAPDAPRDVVALTEEILKVGYHPDPVFSIDICESPSGDLHLLEVGCFSCSGIYAANTDLLVETVSQKAIETFELMQNSGFGEFLPHPSS
jgi:hypothetical protein